MIMCTLRIYLVVVLLTTACSAIPVEIPIATEAVHNDADNKPSTANSTDNVTKTTADNYGEVARTVSTTVSEHNGALSTASKNQLIVYTTASIVTTDKINKTNNMINAADSNAIDKIFINDKSNAETVNSNANMNVLPVNDYKLENKIEKVNSDAENVSVNDEKKENRKIPANIALYTVTASSTTLINDKNNAENYKKQEHYTENIKLDDNSNKTEQNRNLTINFATFTVAARSTTLKRTVYSTTVIKTTYKPNIFVNSTYIGVTRSTDANTNTGTADPDTGINSEPTIREELEELDDFEDENNK